MTRLNGSLVIWNCKFKNSWRNDRGATIILSCDNIGTDINKREAFRVIYEEDIKYYSNTSEYKGRLKDISAVGLAFKSNVLHKVKDILIFTCPNEPDLNVVGRIIRMEEIEDTEYKYVYSVSIVDKDISCFVFRKQAELVRKGKYIRHKLK